jgi:mannitol/fructose-specific phosphotransferase system IIA component (Ntr-type)
MKLTERFFENGIIINSNKVTKQELIEEMVDLLVRVYDLGHREEILEAVLSRESKMSTGIGCGLAVPHAKVDHVEKMCIVAMTVHNGVDFDAIDREPVYLLFLVVSPSNTVGPHIRALSSVSRIMADAEVRKQLIACQDAHEFYTILKAAEEKYC